MWWKATKSEQWRNTSNAISTDTFQGPQVTAPSTQKKQLREQPLLQSRSSALARTQKELPASDLSIHVSITRGDCTGVEKFQMLPPSVHPSPFWASFHISPRPFSAQLLFRYKMILSSVIWTEKHVSAVSAVDSPDQQSSAPLAAGRCPMGLQSLLFNRSDVTPHLPSRELPRGRAENCIKHLWCSCQAPNTVSKYTVLQRTPVCFFPRCKAGNELIWFYIRQSWFDSQEYVIALVIILRLSHLSFHLDESFYLKYPQDSCKERKSEEFLSSVSLPALITAVILLSLWLTLSQTGLQFCLIRH